MAIAKRCWICGSKENKQGNCTNPNCPRYVAETTSTTAETTAINTDEKASK